MGATSIHYTASKKHYKSSKEAYQGLRQEELYEHGNDPYSGTIATCTLEGKILEPKNEDEYEEALDRIHKRECKYYETDKEYVFIGWASC